MSTPVLLITFNRPAYVRQMIDALRVANIQNLYVFKDGPRPNNQNDYNASKEIECIINNIDWECSVKTNYMQNNLGCGYGPYSAISWAFQYEDELIILEDDCVPTIPFFDFCTEMLERYRDNLKVRHISGRSQYAESPVFKQYDYIFTQYAPTWGWATWKRTWQDFDMQMRELKQFFKNGGFDSQFATKQEADFFNKRYSKTLTDKSIVFHIWDFQYGLHSRVNGSLAIVPSENLIIYIGTEGTHPVEANSEFTNLRGIQSFSVKRHPDNIKFISSYEIEYFNKYVRNRTIMERIINKTKRIFNHILSK